MAQKNKDPEKINRGRRQFLKATGMAPIAAGVAGAAVVEAQSGPAIVGPGEVPIELMVNGKRVALRVEPRMTLLNAIRNKADLTGNKRGCDRDALMCGFCTPGFVMATVALIEKHPKPTVDQVKKGLDGNICRCGTFVRIMEAALTATSGAAAAREVTRG